MFIGHFGVGFAAKKAAPKISLGTLFLSAQWIDLIWPVMLILNIEHVKINPGDTALTPLNFINYPYTHSLLFVAGWGFLLGIIYYILRKNRRNAVIVGALVISHWVLDLLVHRPDLPLFPEGPNLGFGLWDHPAAAVVLESMIYAAGIYLYLSTGKPEGKIKIISFWSLVAFLAVIFILNLTGPPPPDEKMISYAGLLMWLIVPWAYWADNRRAL